MNALKLEVVFAAVDKFLRPVKAITKGASDAAKALRENTTRMKEFNRTIEQIDAFKKVERDAAIAANTFKATRGRIDELKSAMDKAGVPTKAMADEMAKLSRQSGELKAKHESLLNTEQKLFDKLKAAGIDTRELAKHRRELASANAEATNSSRKLTDALAAENQKMKRLHEARANFTKTKAIGGKLAGAGAGMMAGGVAVGLPAGKATKDFADFETAMLGVARQMDGARDSGGKVTQTYWEMADAIKAMSERLPMAANDIAKIVEGGARMGIQGKENLLIYAQTTAVMADAFSLPVEQIGEDIGKISQLYKIPIKDIKALGDTINFLDDNALSKGGDIIDVMKRIAGTADMAKMNFKEAAALGSTFLSLGANSEVSASASNAMIRELAVANMQSKRFQGGLAMLGLNGKDVQSSMSTNATGTIIKVLEKIKSLSADKQLEAATRLFGKEFGDDAAKLASNLDEYRRQLKMVNDESARGSMQRESDSRGETLNARFDMAKNAMTNISTDLGRHLKPALVETLEKTLAIVQGVRNWAKENPGLASGLVTVAKWLAVTLTILGGLTLAAGAILIPLATLKFAMITMGISASGALGMIGTALSIFGRALLLNPIGLTLTAIALAATLIYANWDKLGPWLANLIDRIATTFTSLKDRALNAGREMMNGLIAGITEKWEALRTTVTGVASATVGWVKEKLGIRSPSRVFTEIGNYTMQGLENGLQGGADGPLAAMTATAKKIAAIGTGLAIFGGPALATPLNDIRQINDRYQSLALPPKIDPAQKYSDQPIQDRPAPINRPPALSQGQSSDHSTHTYHITFQVPPGTDHQGIAVLVAREIDRLDAKKSARGRSALRDTE